MPVERRSGTKQMMAIGIGIIAVVLAVALAWGILQLSGGKSSNQLRLGDDVFKAGNAVRMSRQINKDGPLLFSDVSGRGQQRPIFVNHFGDDPEIRWVAFDAAAPGAAKNCFLAWSDKRQLFEERSVANGNDRKTGELCRTETFPPNGEGLTQYRWKVDDSGLLTIDFRKVDDGRQPGG